MLKVGKHLKPEVFQETSFQRKKPNPNQKVPNAKPNHVLGWWVMYARTSLILHFNDLFCAYKYLTHYKK